MSNRSAGHELRLALAMRGGVSLAVWIGGAVAEIDEMRSSPAATNTTAGGRFYQTLLKLSGHDRVVVDVLTGASAGGLNGALYSAALLKGVDLGPLREVWMRDADLATLLGGDRSTRASVLDGGHFHDRLKGVLAKLADADASNPEREQRGRLELFLSATVLGGLPVAEHEDPEAVDEDRRSQAVFRFRHHGRRAWLSDLYPVADEAKNQRLARAARATASFPVAFEPMRYEADSPEAETLIPPADYADVDLVDGGVVDNIPVARAINAIADAPALGTTSRWLLYLQPSPGRGPDQDPARESPAPDRRASPSLMGTIRGLRDSFKTETVLDDLDALRVHNDRVAQVRAAREAALGGAVRVEAGGPDATTDALRLTAVLERPATELAWLPVGSQPPKSPLGPGDAVRVRRNLTQLITERYQQIVAPVPTHPRGMAAQAAPVAQSEVEQDRQADGTMPATAADAVDDVSTTPSGTGAATGSTVATRLPTLSATPLRPFAPLARTAGVVIDWALEVSRRVLTETNLIDGQAVEEVKAAAYDVLQLVRYLQADVDRHFLDVVSDSPVDELAEAVDALAERVDAVRHDARMAQLAEWVVDPDRDQAHVTHLDPDVSADETTLRELAEGRFEPAEQRGADVAVILWRALVELADRLASSAGPLRADWTQALETAGADRGEALDRVDRLTVGLHAGALMVGGGHRIRYRRLSGTNPSPFAADSPLAEWLPTLSAPELAWRHDEAEAGGGEVGPPWMSDEAKLAGSDLGNFSAFVSPRWRANDWMWGRLDAVKTLVDVLFDPDAIRERWAQEWLTESSAVADLMAVVEPVVRGAGPRGTELDRRLCHSWDEHRAAVEVEIRAVFQGTGSGRHLERTRLLVTARRQGEILMEELPALLGTSLRPVPAAGDTDGELQAASDADVETGTGDSGPDGSAESPIPVSGSADLIDADRPLGELLQEYSRLDRRVASVWGRKWLTALGMSALLQLVAALTNPARSDDRSPAPGWRSWASSLVRLLWVTPLKALVLTVGSIALGRGRSVAALALLLFAVVMPRLSQPGAMFVLIAGAAVTVGLLWVTRFEQPSRAAQPTSSWRNPRGVVRWASDLTKVLLGAGGRRPDLPTESKWHRRGEVANRVLAVAALAFGALVAIWRLRGDPTWLYPDRLLSAPGDPTSWYLILASAASVYSVFVLWGWAQLGARVVAAVIAGWATALWIVLSTASDPKLGPVGLTAVGSMWWAFVLTSLLLGVWATTFDLVDLPSGEKRSAR